MADLKDCAFTLLASAVAGMQTADGKTTVYTVPTGKKAIISHVVVRSPTASLAGGTDFQFGDGVNADTWTTSVDLSSLTATSDSLVIANTAKQTMLDETDAFGIKPVTGSTANADATIDVFGYEYSVI